MLNRLYIPALYLFMLTQAGLADTTLPIGNINTKVQANGMIQIDQIKLQLRHYIQGKSATYQSRLGTMSNLKQTVGKNNIQIKGKFTPRKSMDIARINQSITRINDTTLRYKIHIQTDQPSQAFWHMAIQLPARTYAGQSLLYDDLFFKLPAKHDKFDLYTNKQPQPVSIPLTQGLLTIKNASKVRIMDVRYYGPNHFSLLIPVDQIPGKDNQWTIDFTLHFKAYSAVPVDLTPVANMGFADQVSGDGHGGWTDEGAGHDFEAFPIGKQTFAHVPFTVADPKAHDGKAALVFAGPQRNTMLNDATLLLKSSGTYRHLYLAHAYAWDTKINTPAGIITANYADGSSSEHEVLTHRDMTNWWSPYNAKTGPVGWTSPRNGNNIGLNVTGYALKNKPLKSLHIQGSGNVVWMIAAMSLSKDWIALPATTRQPLVIKANKQWQPLTLKPDTLPGSILDFSNLSHKPAGKFGKLITKNDQFVFEKQPDQPVRFWGANLCWGANFPDHDTAEKIASRMVMMGYNTVRLHHFDKYLLANPKSNSYTFDPDQLDKIEYLIHCLKKQGLYVSIDLYCSRSFPAGEIDEMNREIKTEIKALIPVSESAYKVWKRFAKNLLTHTNSYTKITWAADPAIVGICPVNENALPIVWSASGDVAVIYQKKFEQWLIENKFQTDNQEIRSMHFARFLTQLQTNSSQRMHHFLKDDLKVKALITGINHRHLKTLAVTRSEFDYVDLHSYHDHPRFAGNPWQLPFMYHNQSSLGTGMLLPGVFFADKLLDKPFTVTEFNYLFPNPHRGESGPVMGAYAAFQQFDGIYRFNYASRTTRLENHAITGLNIATDPINIFSDRMISLLYARGDVQPARTQIPYVITQDKLYDSPQTIGNPGNQYAKLGLITGTGMTYLPTINQAQKLPSVIITDSQHANLPTSTTAVMDDDNMLKQLDASGVLPPNTLDLKNQRFTSDTGEIRLDAKREALAVVTPRSEAFVINDKQILAGQCVSIQGDGQPQNLMVAAMDQNTLAQSRKILIMHTTDALNTQTTFADQERKVLEKWGKAPVLIRRGVVKIKLKLVGDFASLEIWAIDTNGKRLFKITPQISDQSIRFDVNTVPKGKPTIIAYELIR